MKAIFFENHAYTAAELDKIFRDGVKDYKARTKRRITSSGPFRPYWTLGIGRDGAVTMQIVIRDDGTGWSEGFNVAI